MRRLLKAREFGLPEGDISTLEGAMTDTSHRRRIFAPSRDHGDGPAARDDSHPALRGACAELYGACEIRGFLHLYIGEEALPSA